MATSSPSDDSRATNALSTFRPREVRVTELETMLLSRLRGAGILFLCGITLAGVLSLFLKGTVDLRPGNILLNLGLVAVLNAWLFTRRSASLNSLRTAEVLLFGILALAFTLVTARRLVSPLAAQFELGDPNLFLTRTLESSSLYWWFLIILYGTWIPNTGRRCALIVSTFGLIPITLVTFLALSRPELHRLWTEGLIGVLLFWIAAAVAIATYGSHRIHLLTENLATARVLGPYRILKPLGKGSMGEVYLAEHHLLRRPCAIKLIRSDRSTDQGALQRFEREVRVLAQLAHGNIVEIYDTGHGSDGTFYCAMEYLPGLTLQQLVDQHGPLPPARAVHFLKQLCLALRAVHHAHLVHRDIKPSNILICCRDMSFDLAKLLDFGIVQIGTDDAEHLTAEGKFLGTPLYVAPEQIRGRAALDARSDLYSLGGVAYFLLTGEPPFIRDSVPEIFTAHLRDAPVPPSQLRPSLPRDLDRIVLRCLAKELEQRYADSAALAADLSACSATDWSEADAESWWRRNHPELIGSLASTSGLASDGPNDEETA